MSWTVTLEVDSNLRPTELAVMVNIFPGVNDCRVVESKNNKLTPPDGGEEREYERSSIV